jgi:hypothetical protein
MLPVIDSDKPEVEYTYPVAGATLAEDDAIEFTVTDAAGNIVRVLVAAWMRADDTHEMVFDGEVFVSQYAAESTRVAIEDGWAFSVKRVGGWPEGTAVTMRAWAVDAAGNIENVPGGD